MARRSQQSGCCTLRSMLESAMLAFFVLAMLAMLAGWNSISPRSGGDASSSSLGGVRQPESEAAQQQQAAPARAVSSSSQISVVAPVEAGQADEVKTETMSLSEYFSKDASDAVTSPAPGAAKRLKVAFAVFITDVGSREYKDAFAVLAYSFKKARSSSRHDLSLIALCPTRFKEQHEPFLREVGFERIERRPTPIEPEKVTRRFAKEHYMRVQGHGKDNEFLMAEELVKYWGASMTEYDRVLVMDADMLILDPMDELMEREEDFIGTYDHGLDVPGSTVPPVQGGFLLFRPRLEDFNELKSLSQKGEWEGDGWQHSRVGFCYGGVGPVGLLAYWYNKAGLTKFKKLARDNERSGRHQNVLTRHSNVPEGLSDPKVAPEVRMLAVERHIYDVLPNDRNLHDIKSLMRETGKSEQDIIEGVKSVHFTGNCPKPWQCPSPRDWLCKGVLDKWWEMRNEFAAKLGKDRQDRSAGCRSGYKAFYDR
eukprot:TRINITY_DN33123_c0_g2_i1.p1 TRINITY_DN33123_c0_g2~~TRINITY_DN33123_c0_g2_i1.p1  ORF type:complete len:482 (-),score=103.10 TRINITY_DN33123_c0_g2_i1:193-1638(-)